jgi:hypothetical protein
MHKLAKVRIIWIRKNSIKEGWCQSIKIKQPLPGSITTVNFFRNVTRMSIK